MDGKDLFDAPVRHRLTDKQSATCQLVTGLTCSLYSSSHFPERDPARSIGTCLYDFSGLPQTQALRSMIWLLRPESVLGDQFHALSIEYLKIAAAPAQDDQGRPPRMGLQSESNLHRSFLFRIAVAVAPSPTGG